MEQLDEKNINKNNRKVNDPVISSSGTSLTGYIEAPLQKIIDKFEDPQIFRSGKVRYEWVIQFYDGTIATIYDYKDLSPDYNDRELQPEDSYQWHIGSKKDRGFELVINTLIEDSGIQISKFSF